MKNPIKPTIKLSNGVDMPRVGLGVWQIKNSNVSRDVAWALKSGYKMIDTAKVYDNEEGVGQGIIESGLSRKEFFVTTKLSIYDLYRPEEVFKESLERLKLDYIDLYLIHWPFVGWRTAWKGLEKIYKSGKARAIGVSNFGIHQIEEIKTFSKILPMVNQVELHPFLYRKKLIEYCHNQGIQMEAYCPLTHGQWLNNPDLVKIANKYNKSAAQILIRWGLQHDLIMIPKSENKEHIQENLAVFDFEITKEDMQKLDSLNINHSVFPLWSRPYFK